MPGFLTNELPMLSQVGQSMRIPVDTEFPRGSNPASVAATALQVAGTLAEVTANATTASAGGAVTSNQFGGITTTTALTTAPGATYTMTLTNSLITAAYLSGGGMPEVAMYSGSNTGGNIPPAGTSAAMTLQSLTMTAGQLVATWVNNGASALNGTMQVVWHI